MKIIVGLGNPGDKYITTRHNVGFLFIDFLMQKFEFPDLENKIKFKALVTEKNIHNEKVLLVKPQTFMNLSGETIVGLKNFYKCEWSDFLICYDDIDLKFGDVRFRAKGSAGTHNGMRSVVKLSGTEEIPRFKFGIDTSLRQGDLSSFVLGRFTDEELKELPEIFENSLAKIEYLT